MRFGERMACIAAASLCAPTWQTYVLGAWCARQGGWVKAAQHPVWDDAGVERVGYALLQSDIGDIKVRAGAMCDALTDWLPKGRGRRV